MRLLLPLLTAACAFAADPITDETLRFRVLSAIFPDMEIGQVQRRIDSTLRLGAGPSLLFPDALALAPAYRVTGPPQDERERCAAANLVKRTASGERELRFMVFPWPGASRGELLAVLQYRFVDAEPAAACPTLAGSGRWPTAFLWRAAATITSRVCSSCA
ncbi:exported hypothetical protein [Candidatus Sulfopaludibacter sp. SbA3]|nr:exported hypothetical protein [Candidatus Sulfopaludibacter sp. SbA3]